MARTRVKTRGTFPYAYPANENGSAVTRNSPLPGTEGLDFEGWVDESGNTWVRLARIALFGGSIDTTENYGSVRALAVDNLGNLRLAPPSATAGGSTTLPPYSSQALEASAVVKSSPGTVFGISGYNSKASSQFIMLMNATALPADGTIKAMEISVSAASNFSIDFGYWGFPCSAGIVVCNSSTSITKTIGAADCDFTVRYV